MSPIPVITVSCIGKKFPPKMDSPLILVFGQSTFTENQVNRDLDEASNCTLNDPYGLLLIDEEEEEEEFRGIPMADDDDDNEDTALVAAEGESVEEEPQPKFRLFICDRSNFPHRGLERTSLPERSKRGRRV